LSTRGLLLFLSFQPFDGAQDGLQPESRRFLNLNRKRTWMPAFAGMTNSHCLKAKDFDDP
jgi:hypothetical protein